MMSEAKLKRKPLLKTAAPTFAEMLTTGDNLRQFRLGAEQSVDMYLRDHHGDLRKAVRKEIEDARTQYTEDNPLPKSYSPALLWLVLIASVGATLVGFYLTGYRSEQQDNTIHAMKVGIQRLQEQIISGQSTDSKTSLTTSDGRVWELEAGTGNVAAPPGKGTCFDGTKWNLEACKPKPTIGDASPGDTSGPVTRLGGGPANENVDLSTPTYTSEVPGRGVTSANFTSKKIKGSAIEKGHLLELMYRRDCWTRVSADGSTLGEVTIRNLGGLTVAYVNTMTIRDGCPGDVSFNLDGNPVSPKNLAKHPKDVEEVTLP